MERGEAGDYVGWSPTGACAHLGGQGPVELGECLVARPVAEQLDVVRGSPPSSVVGKGGNPLTGLEVKIREGGFCLAPLPIAIWDGRKAPQQACSRRFTPIVEVQGLIRGRPLRDGTCLRAPSILTPLGPVTPSSQTLGLERQSLARPDRASKEEGSANQLGENDLDQAYSCGRWGPLPCR